MRQSLPTQAHAIAAATAKSIKTNPRLSPSPSRHKARWARTAPAGAKATPVKSSTTNTHAWSYTPSYSQRQNAYPRPHAHPHPVHPHPHAGMPGAYYGMPLRTYPRPRPTRTLRLPHDMHTGPVLYFWNDPQDLGTFRGPVAASGWWLASDLASPTHFAVSFGQCISAASPRSL